MWPLSQILLFQNMKDFLLQNEKLVQAKEEKVQILVAIHASLLAIAQQTTLLWAAGVPNLDAVIITGAATSSSEEYGTSTGRITPQGPRTFMVALAPPPCWITLDFLHPLNLLANCFMACDLDSTSKTEAGSDSGCSSERELNDVCCPPSNSQDVSCNPSMRIAYRDLVPMTRLFSTRLLISEGDWRHLINFISGQDILLDLHPSHENFKRTEGCILSKDYNCLVEGCGRCFTNKESVYSHIWAVHSLMGLHCPWVRLDGCCPCPDYFQNWEAPWQCPRHWSGNVLQTWGLKGWVAAI